MIQDQAEKQRVQSKVDAIRALRSYPTGHVVTSGMGAVMVGGPPAAFWNLPLVLAYEALDAALRQMQHEGAFPASNNMLGYRMIASQTVLPWVDYATVDQGRTARNDLAHKGTLAPRSDCLTYIAAVEAELKAWAGVL